MAKYNLVVKYVDDVKYNILWNKMFMESDFNLNSLMHIDFFTSRFKDKRELMDFIEFFELVEKRDIRKRIKIDTFIPPVTRNVFMKYYTPTTENFSTWDEDDFDGYRNDIETILSKFLEETNDNK